MKTNKIYIGKIYILGILVEEKGLLYKVGDSKYYAPKYNQTFRTISDEEKNYVQDLELFDYQNLQSKEHILKIRALWLYQKYMQDLIYTKNLYLGAIVEINDYPKRGLKIIKTDELVYKVGDIYLCKDYIPYLKGYPDECKQFVKNARPWDIPELKDTNFMLQDEIAELYQRKLKR